MSSPKILYSLPKTQPTLSSSSKSRFNTTKTKTSHHPITNESPEVSAFTTDQKQQLYTHNMNIDYGKLSRPFHEELKKSMKKEFDFSQDLNLLLETKKFKNLKQYTLNDTYMNSAEKQGIEPPIHALLTQKKAFSTQKLHKPINPQSNNKPIQQKLKKRNRIISVKAYQTLNPPFATLQHGTIAKQSGKKLRDTNQPKDNKMDSDGMRTDRSDRKISHSRIIKTFNPTAGVQTKIITYPDLTEVIKIRESRKKVN